MRLCMITHVRFHEGQEGYSCTPGFGKFLDAVCPLWDAVNLCVPVYEQSSSTKVSPVSAPNVRVVPLPPYHRRNEAAALLHPVSICRRLWPQVRDSDQVWILMPNYLSILAVGVCLLQGKRYAMRVVGNWADGLKMTFANKGHPLIGQAIYFGHRLMNQAMVRSSALTLTAGRELHRMYGRGNPRVRPFISSSFHESEISDTIAGSGQSEPVLLFVGRLNAAKGLRELCQAVRDLVDSKVPVRLRIAGDGGFRPQLESLIAQLGIEDRVELLGWVPLGPELREVYRRADIFVLPSYAEGSPKAAIEAMANGLPVVASNVGSVPEVVVDAESGYVIPVHDVPAIVQAVAALVRDPELRRGMARNGLSRARLYTMEAERNLVARAFRECGLRG